MKFKGITIPLLALWAVTQTHAQTGLVVTPNLAFQAGVPGQESFEYQIFGSTNLADWSPVSERRVSCGGVETFTLGMTNGPFSFFQAQEFPPDLARRIVGLNEIHFDNAIVLAQGGRLTASGFRVVSRDYDLDDYLAADFQFDLCKQTLALGNLRVSPDLGITCGRSPIYFIKNVTNAITMIEGTNVLSAGIPHTITATGQTMLVNLAAAQVLSMVISPVSVNVRLLVADPEGNVLLSDTVVGGGGFNYFTGPANAIFPGTYTVQLTPVGVASAPVTFRFVNCNNRETRDLVNGQNFSSSIGDYWFDYDKFRVALAAGQTLQLNQPGSGAGLEIFNSLGVSVYRRSGLGAAIFTVPVSGTYYVIYSHGDFSSHNYSSTVTITP